MYVYVYSHIFIPAFILMCILTLIPIYIYICIYVYVYICIYVYMYICIYVYMYILADSCRYHRHNVLLARSHAGKGSSSGEFLWKLLARAERLESPYGNC